METNLQCQSVWHLYVLHDTNTCVDDHHPLKFSVGLDLQTQVFVEMDAQSQGEAVLSMVVVAVAVAAQVSEQSQENLIETSTCWAMAE